MEPIQGRKLAEYNRIHRETEELYHLIAVNRGLSDSAFTIFYSLCELGDGCLQKDICNVAYTSKQTVHSSIRKLEEEGCLRLEQGKGRDKHIYLTEAGEQLIKEKIIPIMQAENLIFETMPEGEGEELIRLSKKYLSLLRENINISEKENICAGRPAGKQL